MRTSALYGNRMAAAEVLCDFSALDAAAARAWEAFIRAAAVLVGRAVSLGNHSGMPPDDHSTFAFISDSAALSRRILLNVPRIYICPHALPLRIDPFFYWKLRLSPGLAELDLEPRTHRLTLLSSVFRGDNFLPGFLHNCAQLQDYRDCEHFLIRAASPGNEHALLVEHVQQWPSAIYLNLADDPGLYEVWNLGIRLASGRYLSNANIDDRRAPEQLACLGAALDTRPEVSAASSVLRISTTANLDWKDSPGCPLMFGGVAGGTYAADALFKGSSGSLAARNLLHCMPVWRRELHARCGFFDERRHGPSADWAFWLRCGMRGARFYFDEQPLGLYLRHDESYWRRNPATADCDARIAAEFAHLAATAESPAQGPATDDAPFSLQMSTALDLLRSGAALEGLGLFLETLRNRPQSGPAEVELASRIGADFLGCTGWSGWLDQGGTAQGSVQGWSESIHSTLVDIFHATAAEGGNQGSARVRRTLEFACFDVYECGDAMQGLLLFAFLARRLGEFALEQELLRYLHARDALAFWSNIQSVYRFSRTLPELCAALPDWAQRTGPMTERPQDVNLVYFPELSGNTYLDLLYRPLREAGAAVSGTSDAERFLSVSGTTDAEQSPSASSTSSAFAFDNPKSLDPRSPLGGGDRFRGDDADDYGMAPRFRGDDADDGGMAPCSPPSFPRKRESSGFAFDDLKSLDPRSPLGGGDRFRGDDVDDGGMDPCFRGDDADDGGMDPRFRGDDGYGMDPRSPLGGGDRFRGGDDDHCSDAPWRKNVLHVHWIKTLVGPSWRPGGLVADRAGAFLEGLARQKERGFEVYWTVHNHLSHECTDAAAETAFRRALYAIADKVFVHHPIAASLLDWLPDHRKLHLCEHGPYEIAAFDDARLAAARAEFGFSEDDFIVTHVGRVRDYKGLAASLPVLLGVLEQIPRMKLVVAGKIGSHEVREWLASHGHPRLIVRDAHLEDEELALRMRVSDLGLLSYSSILTSGTLFLWLGCGRPVLAPAIGSIPAYLVDGWNGFSYSDTERLRELLLRCSSLPEGELVRLGANASSTARRLDWGMWKQ